MIARKGGGAAQMVRYNQKIDAVVYTMGKVGSSSVSTSLKAAGLACLDIHFWAKERLLASLEHSIDDPYVDLIPKHVIESVLARNALTRQKRIKLISLVRNPIMRNISAVFQNMPLETVGDFDRMMERLREYAVRTPDNWFEKDFTPTTGIDILSMDLDRTADHYRFESDAFDVLFMKLETPDARKSELISDFINAKIKLSRTNEANKKWYYDVYRRIIENPALVRPTFVEECLNLRYYKTFYTDEDALALAEKFSGAA